MRSNKQSKICNPWRVAAVGTTSQAWRLMRPLLSLSRTVLLAAFLPASLFGQFNPPPYQYAVYATGTGCAAIGLSGNSYTDSFNSSQGNYSQTKQNTGGNVGVSGNINLSGSATINGTISALNINVGACQRGTPGITISGSARATGGYVRLSAPPSFPNPPPVTPGSQNYTFSRSGSLSPGSYGNITVQGGSTLTLSPGTYNLNSITLSGGSILTFSGTGQVVVNLAGNQVSHPLDFSGGTMVNPSAVPANFQFIYGGTSNLTLSGGASSYGVVYTPNAPVTLSGNSAWFGALVVSTLTDSGSSAIHFDRSLSVIPVLVSVTPNAGQQGQQNLSVALTGQYTHWAQGTTTASFGAGITVASLTVNSLTSATAVLNINPAATPGAQTVTMTTGTEIANLNNGFTVTAGTPVVVTVNPNSGQQGQQNLSVALTGQYTHWAQGTTTASFGAGITVASLTVNSPTSATAIVNIDPAATLGASTVTLTTGTEIATLNNGFTVTAGTPAITGFSPQSGPVGTVVNVSLSNFSVVQGVSPQVTLSGISGGYISAPVSSFSASALTFVVPTDAGTGVISVTWGSQQASSQQQFSVTTSSSFSLSVSPSSAGLIQGQQVSYAVNLTSSNGFAGLAALSVSGVPGGIQATFSPPAIGAGQESTLTLSAPSNQALGVSTLTVSASATIGGLPVQQSATATLQVEAVSTSFVGRTVVDDYPRTPIAGVTVAFLGVDGSGNQTGCTGQTVSDGGGNFSFTNLPPNCTGPQLIGYDGSTATSPPGRYAGVNLSYTLTQNQVTLPPVLICLPRTDNAETVPVQQNAPTDQTFTFHTIPGLAVTVYAGTTFSLGDGSQPDPFPLIAINVPVDRLPDVMPASGMLMPFIVAFQPANATASQPVAVTFPNTLNTQPGVDMTLMTLDPTRGFMVPYGTGVVSSNGTQIIPDPDPNYPGHGYGLVHFDWHGPVVPPPPGNNPSFCATCANGQSDPNLAGPDEFGNGNYPVDLASGLEVLTATDIAISGSRGSISMERTYRAGSGNPGPFGIGTGHNYSYELNTVAVVQGLGVIWLVMPDQNQFPFNQQANGTFTNSTVPSLAGAVLTNINNTVYNLRWENGTVYQFQISSLGALTAYLNSITDSNGNTVTLTLNQSQPLQITQITDPVGRSLNLSYDGLNRITSITDPIGRTVHYTYNGQGTLASVTDPAGGATNYTYDSNNNLLTVTDARGVMVAQNTYDANGRVIQQVEGDGGLFTASYTLLNPQTPATSPVLSATVTDPLGNQSNHRFSPTGLFIDTTDAAGQIRTIGRDPVHNNIVNSITGNGLCEVCPSAALGSLNFSLDANGNDLSLTDALGDATTLTYDPTFNQITSITDPLGNSTRFTYDSSDNRLTDTDANSHTVSFSYIAFGQVTTITDPLGHTTTFSYDAFGNQTSVTDPLGNTTTTTYNAVSRPVQVIDALGRRTTISYDALDRVVAQTDATGNTARFAYDAVGNLLSVTDPRGNTTSFTYDGLNRLLTMTDPLGHTDTRSFDKNGNLVTFVDRRGQTGHFTYDVLNRLIGESYSDGSTVARSYDADGRLIQATDSASGAFDFVYDAAGRLLSSATPFGNVEYSYDADSRVTARQVAGQSALAYVYDAGGNLTSTSLPSASATFTYDSDNRLQNIGRSNGVSSSYVYDSDDRPLTLTHSGGQGIHIPLSYSYDAVGNPTLQSTSVGQSLITQAVTNTFDNANRLLTNGSTSYSYDANGNLVSSSGPGGTSTYTWDSRDRLTSIATPGQTTSFIYDFYGNLISASDTGSINLSRNFVLDDLTNIAYLSQSNGDNLSVLSGRLSDQHLAVIHSSGRTEYGLPDLLSSTMETVDQTGTPLSSFFYEPFGQTTTTSSYPFQFTGRTPVAINLYYNRARYYNPVISRFISEDPEGSGVGSNPYSYANNNPVLLVDPSGRDARVTYYPPAPNNPFGHIAIEINNTGTRGFWPLGHNFDWCLLRGCSKRAHEYAEPFNPQERQVVIHSTRGQDALMLREIDKVYYNPGLYNLYTSNCAQFVEDVLRAAGFKNVPGTPVPYDLFQDLLKIPLY